MAELSWIILTTGHLSMNRFWGETERQRGPLCTSTLIRTPNGLLIVDPSVIPPDMPTLLNDTAGVHPEDVKHVFLTHFHGDHRFGLEAFPHAEWWMAKPEIDHWKGRSGPGTGDQDRLLERIRPMGRGFSKGFRTIFTPGHTPGHTSLAFGWRGQDVAVAGDAVMTEQFFWAREGYHNSADMEAAQESIDRLAEEADIIIPGHGNVFFTALPPDKDGMWTGGRSGI